jgi:transcriptional regulator with XRE-family HTH domain
MDDQHKQPTEASVPYPGFGRVVTARMKEVGVTVDEIADYIEIHPNRVRDYADGKAKTASRDIIRKLAEILRIPVSGLDVEGDQSADEIEYDADKDARHEFIRYPIFLRIVTERMAALGISQSELARRCLVSHTAIAKYLSGKTMPSDRRVQEALIAALGTSAEELFSEQRTRPRYPRPNDPSAVSTGPQNVDQSSQGKEIRAARRGLGEYVQPSSAQKRTRIDEDQYGRPRTGIDFPMLRDRVLEDLEKFFAILGATRRELEITPYSRTVGKIFRYRPDYLVIDDNGPLLGVEVKSGRGVQAQSEIAGIALNWKMTMKEVPLFVVWIVNIPNKLPDGGGEYDSAFPSLNSIHEYYQHLDVLKREGLIAGFALVPTRTIVLPEEIGLESLKKEIVIRAGGVKAA